MTGAPSLYDAVPWFWSNQYDLKLQSVGFSAGYDDTALRGNPETRSSSVIYLRCGQVIALDCVNAMMDYVQGRALVSDGARPEKTVLVDATIPLKDAVARSAA